MTRIHFLTTTDKSSSQKIILLLLSAYCLEPLKQKHIKATTTGMNNQYYTTNNNNTASGGKSHMRGAGALPKTLNEVIGKEWYFWNNYGKSWMGPGRIAKPALVKSAGGTGNKFRIILVNPSANNPQEKVAKVAIAHIDSNGVEWYISCRRHFFVTNSALAEYRKEVGKFETFTMSYCPIDGSFLFQSHNDYFLHYNETYYTVAFKKCSDRKDNFPVKGRWELLSDGETNRVGRLSSATQVAIQMTTQVVKQVLLLPVTAVKYGAIGF